MKGMDMLLKTFGLDPDELQKQFGTVVQGIHAKFVSLENQQQRIEVMQLAILENQKRLFDALHLEDFNDGTQTESPRFRLDYDGPIEHHSISRIG